LDTPSDSCAEQRRRSWWDQHFFQEKRYSVLTLKPVESIDVIQPFGASVETAAPALNPMARIANVSGRLATT